MKTNQPKSFFLIVLHIFLAIGALGGGGALILDPTGETESIAVITSLRFAIFKLPSSRYYFSSCSRCYAAFDCTWFV